MTDETVPADPFASLPPAEAAAASSPPDESLPAADAAAPAPAEPEGDPSSAPAHEGGPGRGRRIGSQRPGSGRVRAKPQFVGRPVAPPAPKVTAPSVRQALTPDQELEFVAAMGDEAFDALMTEGAARVAPDIAPESRVAGAVASIVGDLVFLNLGGQHQGCLSVRQFPAPPALGERVEVVVGRFDAENGYYLVALPGGAIAVEDWSQVAPGQVVEARITGHNKGGLECSVSGLRGFIPISQVALYRVEDLAPFVGEVWPCLVAEANADRGNLVLSRRAVLEREQLAARDKARASIAEGQELEGTVRSLQEFGAFVDLGGVDGLIHISQMSWKRIRHPSELLEIGQRVKVKVRKLDPESGKISLSLRDLIEDPWVTAATRFPPQSVVQGTVTRIMDFGAFVELDAGIEGLVHVSELAHHRVWRVKDVVSEGQTVTVKVLSLDPEEKRIALSIKATLARPEPQRAEPEPEPEDDTPPPPVPVSNKKLKGGLRRKPGGEAFGLKW